MNEHVQALLDKAAEVGSVWGLRVVGGIAILVVGWIVAGIAGRWAIRVCEKSDWIEPTIERYLARLVRFLVMAIAIIAMLNSFGVQTASIIAVLGAMGLAIGLALQGTLSNVASGLMLLILRPFKQGDAVDVGGTSGTVQEIGLFATELKGFDGLCMLVPNAQVLGSKITNFTRNGTRRVDMVFGIGYGDDIAKAMEIIGDVISKDERVLDDPELFIAVGELGASSVDILARPWTKVGDFFGVKCDVTRTIKERFDEEGISIPFPQQDVHVVDMPKADAA
ncbi:MAG: mechanosensitive ion channel [Deltaproteobacteria bacterium]|jgi:small conductance mechanosensitive channel|nr:mechanosensitive ion channel [Deltaproteobacteria bacterium]MBW2535041.1 mechanosensitive ion channel [Deltaproteobacteria bacterium]